MSKLKEGSTYIVDPLNKNGLRESSSICLIKVIETKPVLPFLPSRFLGEVLSPYGDRSSHRYDGSKGMIELSENRINPSDEILDNERVVIRYPDNIPVITPKEIAALRVALHAYQNTHNTSEDDGVSANLKSLIEKVSFFSENVHDL